MRLDIDLTECRKNAEHIEQIVSGLRIQSQCVEEIRQEILADDNTALHQIGGLLSRQSQEVEQCTRNTNSLSKSIREIYELYKSTENSIMDGGRITAHSSVIKAGTYHVTGVESILDYKGKGNTNTVPGVIKTGERFTPDVLEEIKRIVKL